MTTRFMPLSQVPLFAGTTYVRPHNPVVEGLSIDSPAINAMTDLSRVAAVTVAANLTIDAANAKMIANGVRLLLVTDERNCIKGIITATDILGEKPIQFARNTQTPHGEILVRNIMTPFERLVVLHRVDVEQARVGNIIETLKRAGRQHLLVMEIDDNMRPQLRGIFSASQISRQLGIAIEPTEIAQTFAEVEAALGH